MNRYNNRCFLLLILFLSSLILASTSHAGYEYDKSSTTIGGGTWGSILRLQIVISGSNATFTVSKQSGSFSKTSNVYIRYDTYSGTTVASGTISSGDSSKSLSVNLSSISGYPHSFYGYVSNSDGYAYVGPIVVSETVPSTPSRPTATATGSRSIEISWSSVSGASIYTLWRSTSSSSGYSQIYCGSSLSYTDSGSHLSPNTTYYYKLKAGNSSASCTDSSTGWSSYSNYRSVTTLEEVPSTPSRPTATATGSRSIEISWSSVSGASIYTLWRSTSSSSGYSQIYCGSSLSYTDSGSHLSPNTTYYYKLKAGNSSASCTDSSTGWSGYSNYTSVTTQNNTSPTISSVSPSSKEQGSTGFWLYIYGSNFSSSSSYGYKVYVGDGVNLDGTGMATVVSSSQIKVYVTSIDAAAQVGYRDVTVRYGSGSDEYVTKSNAFKVTEASITVTSPNGGEILIGGSSHTITWTSQYVSGNVKISYSIDAGASYTTVWNDTANDGEFVWVVPEGVSSTKCRVSVGALDHPGVWDYSDSNFTIQVGGVEEPIIRIQPTSLAINQAAESVSGSYGEQFEGVESVKQPEPFTGEEKEAEISGLNPAIQALFKSPKIIRPEQVLKDFIDGEPKTRVFVNLHKPSHINQLRNIKDMGIRQQLQEAVKQAQDQIIRLLNAGDVRITYRFKYIFGFAAEVSLQGLQDLIEHANVLSIEKPEILEPHLAQGIPLINATTVRNTYNGTGMSIAICDTGIDYTHPRLGDGGFPNSKVIGGYDTGEDDPDPMDEHGHGTACAGIAAGDLPTSGDYIGGVAYNARLYALKMSRADMDHRANPEDMVEAWEWCIDHQNDHPSNPIMIVSTSFGSGYHTSSCDNWNSAMTAAASNLNACDITLFASSGNDGFCDGTCWPACISHVNAVGAVYDADLGRNPPPGFVGCIANASCVGIPGPPCDEKYYVDDPADENQVTTYSNAASFLDLLAPSEWATTTEMGGGYWNTANGFGGTSAACPYAAGTAACLQSAAMVINGSYLTPAEVKSTLTSTGDLITDTKVSITKPMINLGAAIGSFSGSFTIYNDGGADLEIRSMTKRYGEPWLSWTPTAPLTIAPGGSQVITVSIDWGQLPGYSDQEQIIVCSNDDDMSPYPNAVYINVVKSNHDPDFMGSPTLGKVPLTVYFEDLSTGEITSWSWDFGDAGTSTEKNPSHTYNTPGTYTVSLTVTGPGGTNTETKIGYITVTASLPDVSVTLASDDTVIPRGGTLGFDVTITNNTDEAQTVGFATNIILPNETVYPRSGYLFGPFPIALNPYQSKSGHISHIISGNAPIGAYTYYGYIGKPGVGIIDEDQFDFEVIEGSTTEGPEEWETTVDKAFAE